MYRFKDSLIAVAGLLFLLGIIALVTPHTGYSSGTGTAATSTSKPQDVNVVNAPTVSAQQSGAWSVGINGTPAVSLPSGTLVGIDSSANTVKIDTANPLPVRDVDNPARQPYQFSADLQWPLVGSSTAMQVTVPAGKLLVIEQVSVFAQICRSDSQNLRVAATSTAGGRPSVYHFTGTISGTFGIFDQRVASSQMKLYADPETSPDISLFRNDSCGGASDKAQVNLSGYLVNVP